MSSNLTISTKALLRVRGGHAAGGCRIHAGMPGDAGPEGYPEDARDERMGHPRIPRTVLTGFTSTLKTEY